jgi:subtilisin family serine protease
MGLTRTFLIGLLVGLVCSLPALALDFEVSRELLERGSVNKKVLVFKVSQGGATDPSLSNVFDSQSQQAVLLPLFQKWQNRVNTKSSNSRYTLLNHPLANYYFAYYENAPTFEEAEQILERAYKTSGVEYAYFEPIPEDAGFSSGEPKLETDAEPIPDFEKEQFYLDAAPVGVGAREAWSQLGATGKGIRMIDLETGWFTNHVEFKPVFYDNGKNQNRDHGTAVWGEIAAKRDGVGVTGIAYDSEFGIAGTGWTGGSDSAYPVMVAAQLEAAIDKLAAGDVLIIEQHAQVVDGIYAPIEYYPAVFAALREASDKGVLCIAAAGNGGADLDHERYQGAFDLKVRDSGCILVGASESPKGVAPRTRASFSNYGSRLDAFGYGRDVVTTGYADLYRSAPDAPLATYTARFSGTSSATPIVTGAVVSALSVLKTKGIQVSPIKLREALRATGTPQEGNTLERIGTMPEITQLVNYLVK